MNTIRLNILKTHLSSGQWMHPGTQIDAEESRAKELVRNGLAELAPDNASPARTQRAARVPANKKAPELQNQAMPDTASPAAPDAPDAPAAPTPDTASTEGPAPGAAVDTALADTAGPAHADHA